MTVDVTTFLAAGAVLLVILLLLYRCSGKRVRPQSAVKPPTLIPGWNSKPAHPVLGDLEVALSHGNVYSYLQQKHREEHSPIVAFWWRETRVVSVCSPRAFKETEHLYNKPFEIFGPNSLPLEGAGSIQLCNDSEWEKQKKLIYKTLKGNLVVHFVTDFQNAAKEECSYLKGGMEIELLQFTRHYTLKAILDTCYGNVLDRNERQQLIDAYDYCKCEMGKRFPFVLLQETGVSKEYESRYKELRDYLSQIVLFQRKNKLDSDIPPFLNALLSSNLDEQTIIDNMITIIGGFHTSAYYLTWAFYFLAHHPKVQNKLAREIKEKVKNDSIVELQSYVLKSDTYLRQVLDECFRLSGTAPQTSHYGNQDTEVEGYLVPAHTPIMMVMGLAMTDDKIWENPLEFNPDRFSPGAKAAVRGREFRPFSSSAPRRCPGNQFTYAMASVLLCRVVSAFVFTPTKEHSVEKKNGFVTTPSDKVFIVLEKRDII